MCYWVKKSSSFRNWLSPKKVSFVLNSTLWWKKSAFFKASKKRKSFFFSNFDFFRKKTCTRTSRRGFFENSFEIRLFTCLQKIRILLGRKKRPAPRKTLQDSDPQKSNWQMLKSELWGKLVGRYLGWCGFTVRVRCAGIIYTYYTLVLIIWLINYNFSAKQMRFLTLSVFAVVCLTEDGTVRSSASPSQTEEPMMKDVHGRIIPAHVYHA